MRRDPHPTNQELVMSADGELSSLNETRLRAHLEECRECRARMSRIEKTSAEFTSALLAADAPMSYVAEHPALRLSSEGAWRGPRFAAAALGILVLALGSLILDEFGRRERPTDFDARVTPRITLTPGATRVVTLDEVCSANPGVDAQAVPETLKRRVFEEYGMAASKAGLFEVDYLVTPELGGSQDIRNLWPQPYLSTAWNAHVKDELEGRLHAMVCAGTLDLATAQHDLSNDWISAYKKYFHTQKPL